MGVAYTNSPHRVPYTAAGTFGGVEALAAADKALVGGANAAVAVEDHENHMDNIYGMYLRKRSTAEQMAAHAAKIAAQVSKIKHHLFTQRCHKNQFAVKKE